MPRNFPRGGNPPGLFGYQFYVDSVLGSSSNDGLSIDTPKATIAQALALCSANRGDVIWVAPTHAETITAAAGIDLSVAGVSVIGMGHGSLKPTITMGTATTATFVISAANVKLSGIRFVGNIDSLVKCVYVNADYATIENCDFIFAATKEALSVINLATTKDFLTVRGCTFHQAADPTGTDGAADTGAIFFVDSENILIENCIFNGYFETAFIHNRSTAGKNLVVRNCYGNCLLSGAEPFQLVDGCTGGVMDSVFLTPAETAATEATLAGTLGNSFFAAPTTGFGNDGGAGGQGAIPLTVAS